ncbi:ABC transporter membrane protein [Alloactinosynnema sp. L-07]|uniref:ABC transporter permease n=1 Tax=Alloactinosynnema sp. L-07 TaxID=1653480 RepID=UPI00065EFD82|nr:ABC transporter permease [Alloactinosynnema sp. L-07]CRK56393.1 ABC transporter membrane protein [Alloactinosynnema sp. L-07]
MIALARIELLLLLRNKTTAAMALAMPLLLGVAFACLRNDGDWVAPVTMQVLVVHGLTVYVSTTTALVSRRQDLSLKRLRSGETAEPVILAGVMTPMLVLGLIQGALFVGIAMVAGAPLPKDLAAMAAAIVGGTLVAAGAGLATAAVTATPENAQITTAPLVAAMMGGAMWVLSTPAPSRWLLAVPGGATAELVRAGLDGGRDPLVPIAVMIAWAGATVWLGRRYFRWEPRS